MPEIYLLKLQGSCLDFALEQRSVPASALSEQPGKDLLKDRLELFCRMGDPDLLHCLVFRNQDNPGGIFALHDHNGLLFAAIAENNLVFALANGFFGEMVANSRYGVDIYEEFEEPND